MADKSIFELNLQTTFATNDRLVVGNYANSDAEAITGQTLVNLLATSLDGHGGIQSITKTSSTGTDPVVDTYTITFADTSTTTFQITNGLKGDTGAQTFVYFRWAHEQPSSWSDTTNQPDEWMGIYAGTATTPPTTVSAYTWVKVRGATGDTGEAATINQQSVTYMESASGTVVPEGSWTANIPSVTPGNFLWTRTQLEFNDGSVVTSYSVSRYGIDGTGSVSTVNGVSPDANGNIALTASNIPTLDNQSIQAHITDAESDISDINTALSGKQDTLVSGTNIKTVNGASLLGYGNLAAIPTGGAAGKVLVKASASDYDVTWGDAGVSSVNGATGTVVLDAEDVGAMSEWVLLWENASPTSEFAAQTISLDLSGYDAFLIVSNWASNTVRLFAQICFLGENGVYRINGSTSNARFYAASRVATIAANGITFTAATEATASTSSSTDGSVIPYKIYGIKGVA